VTSDRRPLHLCFGGTFDPVHNGHLRVLWEAALALQADSVRLLPCYIPPHKDQPESSPSQRLDMLRLAIRDQPSWLLDDRELRRDRPSYTIETLLDLRDDLGQDAALVWLLGMDSFASLNSWYRWQELGEHAHLAVVGRPGSMLPSSGPVADWARGRQTTVQSLRESAAGVLVHLATTQQDIASSNLRAGARAGLAPRYLVPDTVCTYIVKHRLYS
jgi:nicotinate-nucleotide adenylyltransferase